MKYKIDNYVLDERSRTLSGQGNSRNIRPKTQALLLYLAQNKGQIISKQTLLDTIWHDVNVDEGVVFQSVREIRQLFNDPHIIQNHPRLGYEFTGQFDTVITEHFLTKIMWLPATIIILLAAFLSWQYLPNEHEDHTDFSYKHGLLVLPVKNQVHYGQHDWVYLGAMEQLIGKLKGLPDEIYVHDGSYTLGLINQLGLSKSFTSEDIAKQFAVMGSSMVIETEVHGNTSDYKLIYTLHRDNAIKQGAILSTSIDGALSSLTDLVAAEFGSTLQPGDYIPTEEFNDALFAQALISYEQDWETSISFFESYLVLQPESVIAKIYLSKLYLWQDKPENAAKLMEMVKTSEHLSQADRAQINILKARIAQQSHDFKTAHAYFRDAEHDLKDSFNWFLKASIAEEQGHAWLAQKQFKEAQRAWLRALRYFRIVNSPIGIHSANLHLANVAFELGQFDEARSRLSETRDAVHQIELEFLYSMLQNYEQKILK